MMYPDIVYRRRLVVEWDGKENDKGMVPEGKTIEMVTKQDLPRNDTCNAICEDNEKLVGPLKRYGSRVCPIPIVAFTGEKLDGKSNGRIIRNLATAA
jgi:hypothetical protein